jgi:hypothetical protein
MAARPGDEAIARSNDLGQPTVDDGHLLLDTVMAACCSTPLSLMAACCSTPLSVMAACCSTPLSLMASDGRLLLDATVGDGRLLLDATVGDGRLLLDARLGHTATRVWTAIDAARLGLGTGSLSHTAIDAARLGHTATRVWTAIRLGLGTGSLGHTAIDAARLTRPCTARPVWHTYAFGQPLTRYTIQFTPRPSLLCWQAWNMVAASIWMGSSVATTDGFDFEFNSPLL